MLESLKQELKSALSQYFPLARVESKERRGVVLEIRVHISERCFIEIYANAVTGKRSFTIISNNNRLAGYDNYKFWHYHPPYAPSEHVSGIEPSVDSIISEFKRIIDKPQ